MIGMANPQGREPLWPDPPGCAGHRLWQMAAVRSGVSMEEWLAITDRRNLCPGQDWDPEVARATAREWRPELMSKTTVMLGADVALAFGLTTRPFQWAVPKGTPPQPAPPWIQIPHPSGRTRTWNDPFYRSLGEILLADLVEECRRET